MGCLECCELCKHWINGVCTIDPDFAESGAIECCSDFEGRATDEL